MMIYKNIAEKRVFLMLGKEIRRIARKKKIEIGYLQNDKLYCFAENDFLQYIHNFEHLKSWCKAGAIKFVRKI